MVHANRNTHRVLYLVLALISSLANAQVDPEDPEQWWTTVVNLEAHYSQSPQSLCDLHFADLSEDITHIFGAAVHIEQEDVYYDASIPRYVCVFVSVFDEPGGGYQPGDEFVNYNRNVDPVICPVGEEFNPVSEQCEVPIDCPDAGTQAAQTGPIDSVCIDSCRVRPEWPGQCNGNTYDYSCVRYVYTGAECTDGPPFPPNGCPANGEMNESGACTWDSDPPNCPGQTQYIDGNCTCANGGTMVPENGYSCENNLDDPDPFEPPGGDDPPDNYYPDTDGDGDPNNQDSDIDGDGIPNTDDDDIDGDGFSNIDDDDDDGDFIPDSDDQSPQGPGESSGPDTNNCPEGTTYQAGYCQCDNVGEVIVGDRCASIDPTNPDNGTDTDTDGDGNPDSTDPDIDGDGIPNGQDGDTDGDGVPDEEDDNQTGGGSCPADWMIHQINDETTVCLPNPSVAVTQCGNAVTCSGDAIQCAQLQVIHQSNCELMDELQDDDGIQDAIDDQLSGLPDGYGPAGVSGEEIDATDALDYSSSSGSCPAPVNVSMLGGSIEISFDGICEFAVLMRPFLVAIGLFIGGRIFLGIEV